MPINNFLLPGAKFTPLYDVANSCRFNDGDSPSLTKTHSSAGNRRTFTISAWIKRSTLSYDYAYIFTAGTYNSTQMAQFKFDSNDQLNISGYASNGSQEFRVLTTQKFMDVSAWYHLLASVDTTQGTASNRVKLYINGTLYSGGFEEASYPSEDYDSAFNSDIIHSVGIRNGTSSYYDGYMAELVMVDGSALAASSFGEFDEDSPQIFKPKDVSGLTAGTNGFYLDFEDSSNLGNDAFGGTDWTANNLSATDSVTDVPTNNFCTVNPLDQALGTFDISEGNLKYERTSDTTNWKSARGTIGIPNGGKWYWEMAKVGGSVDGGFGGIATDVADLTQEVTGFWGFHDGASGSNYTIYNTGYTDVGSSYNISDDDIIQIAFDRDNNKLWVGRNNTWGVNGGTPVSPSDPASGFLNIPTNVLPAFMIRGSFVCVVNFGQDSSFAGNLTGQNNSDGNGYGDFYYTPPSGYLALCTKNVGSDGG